MATLNLGRIKPVFRGAYSGSTAYVVDDIVTHGNESFICIQAHGAGTQATSVTAYWTKLAAKGTDGTDVGTTITTQGDILYRDGSGLQRLAKGTAAQTLKMNSGATAPEWVTAAGGSILQMKTVQMATFATTTSTSLGTSAYDIAGLTMVMTPTLATSHILVTGQLAFGHDADYVGRGYLTYNHSGISETVIKGNQNTYGMTWRFDGVNSGDTRSLSTTAVNIFLSPATVNAITFKVRMMTSQSGSASYLNGDRSNTTNSNDGGNDISSLTFWEIGNSITPTLSNTDIAT